jgi:hypothetical protein
MYKEEQQYAAPPSLPHLSFNFYCYIYYYYYLNKKNQKQSGEQQQQVHAASSPFSQFLFLLFFVTNSAKTSFYSVHKIVQWIIAFIILSINREAKFSEGGGISREKSQKSVSFIIFLPSPEKTKHTYRTKNSSSGQEISSTEPTQIQYPSFNPQTTHHHQ